MLPRLPRPTPQRPLPPAPARDRCSRPGSGSAPLRRPRPAAAALRRFGTAAAAPAASQEAQPDADLKQAVENYWHYGKTYRYDLATAEAQKIIAKKDSPVPILVAFEQVAKDHGDEKQLDAYLLRWQGTDQLKDVTTQILTILNDGRRTRRGNPEAIEANVKRLTNSGRGYMLAVRELRDSGELAVPIMIDYLRDPAKAEYHSAIRDALRDIGRPVLNPLVAATESKNPDVLIPVVGVLGDLGYGAAVPYLDRLAISDTTPPAARAAATSALQRMGAGDPRSANAAELFYELGEKFYYDNADITADKRDPKAPANIWYWDEQKGLIRQQVPQPIFNEIMAMRACEYALKLGQSDGDAISLWLDANYKREAELPEGQTDPTRAANQPTAHFYGVDSGPQYLSSALARALHDHDSRVALRVIKSLQEIIGRTDIAPALIDAMGSSDRLVRFEAAFAIAAALPQQPFNGQDRVVPLLAEAMSQTGTPSALVMMPGQDRTNATVDALKQAGYNATGGASAAAAIAAGNQLPAVDVIITSEDMGPAQVDQLLAMAAQNARLAGAAKVVVVRSAASPYVLRASNDATLSTVTMPPDYAALKTAADNARAKSSSAPIDAAAAASYALRSADLLGKIALTQIQGQNTVLNLAPAEQTVLAALNDSRPDVVKAAGQVLSLLNSTPAQPAMLTAARGEKVADDVRVSLLKSLATSAKFFGNRLDPAAVTSLDEIVDQATNQDVKNAAAEARGALQTCPSTRPRRSSWISRRFRRSGPATIATKLTETATAVSVISFLVYRVCFKIRGGFEFCGRSAYHRPCHDSCRRRSSRSDRRRIAPLARRQSNAAARPVATGLSGSGRASATHSRRNQRYIPRQSPARPRPRSDGGGGDDRLHLLVPRHVRRGDRHRLDRDHRA